MTEPEVPSQLPVIDEGMTQAPQAPAPNPPAPPPADPRLTVLRQHHPDSVEDWYVALLNDLNTAYEQAGWFTPDSDEFARRILWIVAKRDPKGELIITEAELAAAPPYPRWKAEYVGKNLKITAL